MLSSNLSVSLSLLSLFWWQCHLPFALQSLCHLRMHNIFSFIFILIKISTTCIFFNPKPSEGNKFNTSSKNISLSEEYSADKQNMKTCQSPRVYDKHVKHMLPRYHNNYVLGLIALHTQNEQHGFYKRHVFFTTIKPT